MEGKITEIKQVDDGDRSAWRVSIALKNDLLCGGGFVNNFFYYVTEEEPDVHVGQAVHVDVTPVYQSVEDIPEEAFVS